MRGLGWWAIILVAAPAVLGGCGNEGAPRPQMALQATPAQTLPSYPGGLALWVVKVTLTPNAPRPVRVTASSVEGVACAVVPSELNGSGNVEVLARPNAAVEGRTVNVRVRAELAEAGAALDRPGRLTLPLQVTHYQDTLGPEARTRCRPFLRYLAAHHPELGLSEHTTFEGWVPAPNILVVMWYSFLSADCEVLIRWHVMIPPYDWTRVYVRRRGAATTAWAGEISTAGAPVKETPAPELFPRFEAPVIPLR